MADYTLRGVQQQVDDWVSDIGKGYWSPHEMAIHFSVVLKTLGKS